VLTIQKLKYPHGVVSQTEKTQKIQVPAPLALTQQPSSKGRKRDIFHNDKQQCSPAAHHSNLNTPQQELSHLQKTYAHANMLEIQQQIKNCQINAPIQVANGKIPKCLSCSKKKKRKDHTNNTAAPSRKMITTQD
jgi:hypothetical protein